MIQRSSRDPDRPCLRTALVRRRAERNRGTRQESSSAPIPEPFPGLQASNVQEQQEVIQINDDETLADVLLGDGFLTPVMNSVFDSSGIDDQTPLPPEPFPQTEADLFMEGLLTGVQSQVEISSDSGSVL